MKKIIILALATILMVGCDYHQTTENIDAPKGGNLFTSAYQTVMIDSCEYIHGTSRIAHKGNCKYCAERRKQELKELVKQIKEE